MHNGRIQTFWTNLIYCWLFMPYAVVSVVCSVKIEQAVVDWCEFWPVCSEACCTAVQCAGGCHSRNVHWAAMSGEWGLPCFPVPLVPQQRGASTGSQKQPEICQLLLQHQPRHWRPGTRDRGTSLPATATLSACLFYFSLYKRSLAAW